MEETRKEEILARSKRENRNGDERERTIRIQGESFSLIFILLMGIVLIAWKRAHGLPDEDVLAMFWMSCLASRVYRLSQRRDKSVGITAVISLAFLVYNLVKFFQIAG